MFSKLYFAALSALSTEDALRPAEHVLHGRIAEAVTGCAILTDRDPRAKSSVRDAWQLYGDLQLIVGLEHEAEESYRMMQKVVRPSRDGLRIASCRSAAWLLFFRGGYPAALTRFIRIINESAATVRQRLCAHIGAALSLHQIGCLDAVCQHLLKLERLAREDYDARWTKLVDALSNDIRLHYNLRCSGEFADHVYWRSVCTDFLPRDLGEAAALASKEIAGEIPLLGMRFVYLNCLRSFAAGRHEAIEEVDRHMRWSLNSRFDDYYRSLCLDMSLAALAADAPSVAEAMLSLFGEVIDSPDCANRGHLDYLYCLSKVRCRQGRSVEAIEIYNRYAGLSMRQIRADMRALSAQDGILVPSSQGLATSDDFGARLSAKYRRAYRYILENLDRRELSVREVAAHIGVTERALQAVFKANLGLSPRELIRRQRMERVREQLLAEEAPPRQSAGDSQQMWRSTQGHAD